MRYLCLPLLSLALLATVGLSRQEAPNVVPSDPLSPADEVKKFVLPEGFVAELVASEPDIKKPMNLAFDDEGRLWVTDSIEYPFPARPGAKARDSVKVLSDFGPDGKARSIRTFASGLNIPIGLLPLPGKSPREALVYSINNIYRLRDSTRKGSSDQRQVLFGPYEYRDTHGMTSAFTPGFDGWIYACHGYANRSTIRDRAGHALTMHSGNTYRMRPDGSKLQQWTWGQVNPFGLCFDARGNLYSADCHSQPIYQLLRGGYYPSFGKPHDGLSFAPEMITNYRGSTAIAGIVYYAADHFPPAYQGSAFVGDVMTNQIVHFELTWTGTTPRATQRVLLQSKDQWFRPVDLKLGPDGALYVADFYNRIIGHYEVPLTHPGRDRERGRIWRIVYKGKGHTGTPAPRTDWTKASVNELASDLAHPNLSVRMQATQQLVKRGKEAVKAVRPVLERDAATARAHALWVLDRLDALEDADLVKATKDRDDLVRIHVQRVLAERAKLGADLRNLALAGLKDDSPHAQRAAAEALGQHPDAVNIQPLLALRHRAPRRDTHLVHVVRMALRNQLRIEESWKAVAAGKWDDRDARALADVALGVSTRDSAHFLIGHIATHSYPLGRLAEFVHHGARHGDAADTKALVSWARQTSKGRLGDEAALVRAIHRGSQERGAGMPAEAAEWANELAGRLLAAKHENEQRAGTDLVAALRLADHRSRVIELASSAKAPDTVRVAALNALVTLDTSKNAGILGKILTDSKVRFTVREHAAGLLARANQPATRAELLAAMPVVPARLQNSIAAGLVLTREGSELLLSAVASGKASARLLTEKAVAFRLLVSGLPDVKKRLAKLTEGLPAADARLQQLIETRRKGYLAAKTDLAKGAAVFEKQCGNCHQVAGKGAKIGPQLDGIGLRGLERLLEDVLDPNRNVDQAFRLTEITTLKGQVIPGLLLREEGAVLILADNQGKEVRVRVKDVEKRTTSQLSPMPANFGEQISETDFHHLMAYLLSLKPSKP
jgi:putative heme-binding domain-containing protein